MSERFLETPNPFPRESALGWTLRAAELNGLPNALKLVDLCKSSRTTTSLVKFNPGELASWFGKTPSQLEFMSYKSLRKNDPPLFRKQPVASKMLNLLNPRICPSCVQEDGYIHALWDLDLVTVCPTHGISLVSRCSACDKHLSWKRPGLLLCACGAKIESDGVQVSKSLVIMHKQLEITAYSKQTKTPRHLDIGKGSLKDISLRFLIKFIEATARMSIPKGRARMALSVSEKNQILEKPAELLSDWPIKFCDFLDLLHWKPHPESKRASIFCEKSFLGYYIEKLFAAPEDYMEGAEVLITLLDQILKYPNSGVYSELPLFSIWYSRLKDKNYCSVSDAVGPAPSTIPKGTGELCLTSQTNKAADYVSKLRSKKPASDIWLVNRQGASSWLL